MRIWTALLLSLAACGGSSKSRSLGSYASGEPAGAPPTIAWTGGNPADGGEFVLTGLPAIADDGSRVLLGRQGGDGGRGYPNLELVVLDRADKTVDSRVVLDADQVEAASGPVEVASHNTYLADSNAAARWRPLARAEVKIDGAEGDPCTGDMDASSWTATVDDVTVRFDVGGRVQVVAGGKTLVDATHTDWLVEPHPMYEGAGPDEVCENPVFLSGAFIDTRRHLALVETSYFGTDTCWEPGAEYHVVTW